jgi:2-desacetyl-2-hydroxyethyl bacteriochlorophyllide A dehydrogenase
MATTYKAIVWTGVNQVEAAEKKLSPLAAGQVLLKVRAAGICGTDLHTVSGKHPTAKPPVVLGHEFAGEVVDVGPGVGSQLVGKRVGSDSYVGCGQCKFCLAKQIQLCEKGTCELGFDLDGGWAEYVVAPAANLYPLPDTVGFDEAGAGCILNCPMAAIETIGVYAGDTVLILGDGPSSLIMVQLARLKGAREVVITGHRQRRLSLAVELGADTTINTHQQDLNQAVRSLATTPNVVIDAVGTSETFAQALRLAGKYGRIHIFGLPEGPVNQVPLDQFLWKELTLKGSTGNPALWPAAMALISRGLLKVKPMITHRFTLDKAPEALEFIHNNRMEVIKAIFEMNP